MSASRNERKKRRAKRNMTLLKRQLKTEAQQNLKTHITLFAVLAQKGGEVTITEGTLNQVMGQLKTLGYSITPSAEPGEMTVRLVVNADVESAEYSEPGGDPTDGIQEATPPPPDPLAEAPEVVVV